MGFHRRFQPLKPIEVHSCGIALPTDLLYSLADPERMRFVSTVDLPRTLLVEQWVREKGIEPLLVVYDGRGAVLRDGHHRLYVAALHRIEHLPVTFERSPHIPKWVLPWEEFMMPLVRAFSSVV